MDTSTLLELFGYLGSLVVIVSMLMTSVFKLRVINTIGSLMFSAYALMIHSYPTMVMNLFLAGINIWHLMKLRDTHRQYDLVEVTPQDEFLKYLIDTFQGDILKFFPDFTPERIKGCCGYVILCQSSPAGLFLAEAPGGGNADAPVGNADAPGGGNADTSGCKSNDEPAGVLDVVLDYTTPTYRDCSVGRYLYRTLTNKGYSRLVAEPDSDAHRKYLEKMGFRKGNDKHYVLELDNDKADNPDH